MPIHVGLVVRDPTSEYLTVERSDLCLCLAETLLADGTCDVRFRLLESYGAQRARRWFSMLLRVYDMVRMNVFWCFHGLVPEVP